VTRRWAVLETDLAERGLWRSQRHAGLQGRRGLTVAIRREWSALRRRQRRAQAQARQPRRSRADRVALGKYRVQAHYLRHRGFLRSGDLDRAVVALVGRGVPIDWVHGRCDAVCPPANSRRWAALGGRLTLPLSGHLGHEPDLLAALRARVRGGAP
jgi:proline iminopeptidase